MSRPDVLIGDRYRLVDRIAVGGMSAVWEAWDERLQRRVAIKQLHPQPGLPDSEARLVNDRAMREARITARLHHAHAVPVYDVVDHEGAPCLVMQYLPSTSLADLIRTRGPLDVPAVARIGAEVASALVAAHQVGIVHRDVKPGNVLIDSEGSAKLTDFGISHAMGDVTLTSTGMVTGTPAFLAPEVARGDASTPASDVYSLGATLYAALEGRPPSGEGDNPMATLHRVASGHVITPRRAGALGPLLQAMLAADPAARPSPAEVQSRLGALRGAPVDPRAAAATEQLTPPPPSTTISLPPVRPPAGPPRGPAAPRHRRPGRWIAAALLAAALLAGAIVLLANLGSGSGSNTAGGGSPTTAPTRHTSATHSASSATTRASTSASPPPTPGTDQQANHAGRPTKAVSDYYALLPGNTDAAWARLTTSFQNGRAGGRQSYDDYWASIRKVSAKDVTSTGPQQVDATIHYEYNDGRTADERTRFDLVLQDGIWKIDATTLVSSGGGNGGGNSGGGDQGGHGGGGGD